MVQRELRFLVIELRADGRSWDMNHLIQWAQGHASSTFDRGELKFFVCAASQQERGSKAKRDQRNGRQTGEALQSSSCSMSSTQPSAA